MARIVTTQYRPKRPPKKKRPVAIEVAEVVTVHNRKRVAKATRSDDNGASVDRSTATTGPTKSKAANDDRKAAIVTAKTPTEIREERRRCRGSRVGQGQPALPTGKHHK